MIFHVEHTQEMRRGFAWCGASVTGPRINGLDNMLYHMESPQTAAVCGRCLEAILSLIGSAVTKTLSHGGE